MNSDNIDKVIQIKKELGEIKILEEKLKFITLDMSNIKITISVETETSGIKILPTELHIIDAGSLLHDFFQNLKKKRKEKVTELYKEIEKL